MCIGQDIRRQILAVNVIFKVGMYVCICIDCNSYIKKTYFKQKTQNRDKYKKSKSQYDHVPSRREVEYSVRGTLKMDIGIFHIVFADTSYQHLYCPFYCS